MTKDNKDIRPIKDIDELKELNQGKTIFLNDDLTRNQEIEAKNKGFEPKNKYIIFDAAINYKFGPFSPPETDEKIEYGKTVPYRGYISIINPRKETFTADYRHFSRTKDE